MSRDRLAAVLGAEAALLAAVLLLVGSDLRSTTGVAWAVLAALGLGLVTGISVRIMFRREPVLSPGVALVIPAFSLALYLVLVALVLMMLNPGEGAVASPGPVDRVILGFVAACVGWLAGAVIGALALLTDRYRDGPSRSHPGAPGRPGAAYALALGIPGIVIALALILRLSAT